MKLLAKTVLSAYLLFLLWLVLFKFSIHLVETFEYHIQGLNLIPFAETTQNGWKDVVYNILFFVPFGLLLSVNLKQISFWQKLACIGFFSLVVEIFQGVFAIGITDTTDVLTNITGGLLGLVLYGLSRSRFDSKKVDRWSTVTIGTLIIVAYAFIGNFQLSRERHRPTLYPKTTISQLSIVKDLPFAWPETGQAAIAHVEAKTLARSSGTEKQRSAASMAKVITALAILEKQPLKPGQEGPAYLITERDIERLRAYIAEDGSVLPLKIGAELTQYQALQRMLIASDNYMADMLSERIFGSKAAYISYAQEMLLRMGLSRTVVADASGFGAATVSTPSELVVAGIAALQNPVIAEIVAQQRAELPDAGVIHNTNQLLRVDGVIGIKTGTTDEAGSCLLFAARYAAQDGTEKTIVGVIMGSRDHASLYSDSRKLLVSAKQIFGAVEDQSRDAGIALPRMQSEPAMQR